MFNVFEEGCVAQCVGKLILGKIDSRDSPRMYVNKMHKSSLYISNIYVKIIKVFIRNHSVESYQFLSRVQ